MTAELTWRRPRPSAAARAQDAAAGDRGGVPPSVPAPRKEAGSP